jgi:8-amino-7-oxononanoate synthase
MDEELKDVLDGRHRISAVAGRDVFAKALAFDLADRVRQLGFYPFFRPIDSNEGPEATVDGRRVLMFGSNNYLGLTTHERVRKAAIDAISRYGTSLTGSRLLNGTLAIHGELEDKLAGFLGKEAALVFTTGYQVNLGILQALVGKGSALVLDHRAHASLFDAARMTDGVTYTFRHADPAHFAHVLSSLGDSPGVLVALEGVFSMDGDVVDLPAFLEVAERYGARVVLDDAHGVGVHGEGGRGTASRYGVSDRVDLIAGTFSKSLASIGGFVAGPAKVIDYIRHFGRSFLFTASLPPSAVAAAAAALDVLIAEPELVLRLEANVRRYRDLLRKEGIHVAPETTPVVPIRVGDEGTTLRLWKELLDAGLYVNAALPPAVPRGQALLRTSVMATHSYENIASAAAILGEAGRKYGLTG